MEELIAKRYVKALSQTLDKDSLKSIADIFAIIATHFEDKKFLNIIKNPNISKLDKETILLESIKGVELSSVKNFIKLLVENGRVNIIPSIANVLKKEMAHGSKVYEGVVYSDEEISKDLLLGLSSGLSKRFDSQISLKFIKNSFDGVKVDVNDLGVEINFSKTRINNQMIEHILKAI